MLEEPFWLGLLTVFIVLGIIGLVWCARRHFPEKLEKLLAEEAERNRHCVFSTKSLIFQFFNYLCSKFSTYALESELATCLLQTKT